MNVYVGLGNPGSQYEHTRHNIGWKALDELARRLGAGAFSHFKKANGELAKTSNAYFLKPQTFMNRSGDSVRSLLDFYNLKSSQGKYENLWVVHDDLDIPFGAYKIQFGKGPKGHNGLLSIYQQLGTDQFWHVRIGVDGREGDRTVPPHQYVLQNFMPAEQKLLAHSIESCVQDLIERV